MYISGVPQAYAVLIKCIQDPPDNFDIYKYVSFITSSTRCSSHHKLKQNLCRKSRHRHFSFNRIVKLWNVFQNSTFLYLSLVSNLYLVNILGIILLIILILKIHALVTLSVHVTIVICPMLTAKFCSTDRSFCCFQQKSYTSSWCESVSRIMSAG